MKRWMAVVFFASFFMLNRVGFAHDGESHEAGRPAPQKITGEVVDLACYLSSGAMGTEHQACAQKCIASGLPVGIKSGNQIYVAVSGEHGPANEALAPLAGKQVQAEGYVTERDGVHLIAIKNVTVVTPKSS